MAKAYFSNGSMIEGPKSAVKKAVKTMKKNFPEIKHTHADPTKKKKK